MRIAYVIKDNEGNYYDYAFGRWGDFEDASLLPLDLASNIKDGFPKKKVCFVSKVEIKEVGN